MSKLWESIRNATEHRPYNEYKREDGKFNYVHQEQVPAIAKSHVNRIFHELLKSVESLPVEGGLASPDTFKKSVVSLIYQHALKASGSNEESMEGHINRLKEFHDL